MRLGTAHEVGLLLATTLAYLIVLLGGELPAVAWLVLGTPLVSFWLKRKKMAAPGGSGTMLAAASLVLAGAQIAAAGIEAAVLAGGVALLGILTARLLTRQSLAHDLQALLLSLLLVFAGSILNVGLTYGVIFVAFSISGVWSLTTRQLLVGAEGSGVGDTAATLEAVKTRRDVVTPAFLAATGSVALSVLAITGLVFFAFPRIGVGNFGMASGRSGLFPSAISLRGSPRASAGSSEIVARVEGISRTAFFDGLYLRGGVYDVINDAGFGQAAKPPTLDGVERALVTAPQSGSYEVFLHPIAGELLFTLGGLTNARVIAGGRANPSFRVGVSGTNTRSELVASRRLEAAVRYQVRGGWAVAGYIPNERDQKESLAEVAQAQAFFLRLPERLTSSLQPLVERLTQGLVTAEGLETPEVLVTPEAKARVFREYLLANFVYTLEQPSGAANEPLLDFLTNTKAGHCEYFATAYAAMLRAAGIPSRVVGGYQGGKWDAATQTAVFFGYNAHAWVEWFLPGAGWVTDDPTPTAQLPRVSLTRVETLIERIRRFWDDTVIDYALDTQVDALKRARSFFSEFFGDTLSSETPPAQIAGFLIAATALAGVIFWLARRQSRRRRRQQSEHPLAGPLLLAIGRLAGRTVSLACTLREAVSALPVDSEQAVVLEILQHYEADRFGAEPMSEERIDAAVKRLQHVGLRREAA